MARVSEPVDPHALTSAARDLMRIDADAPAGLWARAASLLARQALELALRRMGEIIAPGLEETSMRCQLLCAGTLLNDRELGGRTAAAWSILSDGCHHRTYALPPTAVELNSAFETVWALADALEALRGRVRRG
jgi:hypothetical protein